MTKSRKVQPMNLNDVFPDEMKVQKRTLKITKKPVSSVQELRTYNDDFLKKFCEAFQLNPDDSDFDLKMTIALDRIRRAGTSQKNHKIQLEILYMLYRRQYYSFNQFANFFPATNRRELSNILDELLQLGFVITESELDPVVRKINSVYKFSGETKKRLFYRLNYENAKIEQNIEKLENFLDDSFKKRVLKELSDFNHNKKNYEKFVENQKFLSTGTRKKSKIPLINILRALSQLINHPPVSSNHLARDLVFRHDVTSFRKWNTHMRPYLIEAGFLKPVTENDAPLLQITIKCRKYLEEHDIQEEPL